MSTIGVGSRTRQLREKRKKQTPDWDEPAPIPAKECMIRAGAHRRISITRQARRSEKSRTRSPLSRWGLFVRTPEQSQRACRMLRWKPKWLAGPKNVAQADWLLASRGQIIKATLAQLVERLIRKQLPD